MALRIRRLIRRHGEEITRQIRTAGTRDASTKQMTYTFTTTEIVTAYLSPPLTKNVKTQAGIVTEQVRTVYTRDTIAFHDRLVFTEGTFQVEEKPQVIYKRRGETQKFMFRMARVVEMELDV